MAKKIKAKTKKVLFANSIKITGARVHNLKNVSLEIPKNQFVVVTGLSGSGKSSLAFDTIYSEGQRRYAESLSSYARQFMETQDKPDVDKIEGLSPTIAIDQKVSTQNPRSTVGTVTEIYDFFRLLFARVGVQYCPDCKKPVEKYEVGQIIETARRLSRNSGSVLIYSPIIRFEKVDKKSLLESIERTNHDTLRIDGKELNIKELRDYDFGDDDHSVDLLIANLNDVKTQNPLKMIEEAIDLSNGFVVLKDKKKEKLYSTLGLCPKCGLSFPSLDMRSFSYNSPYGACSRCSGLGITKEINEKLIIPNPRLSLAQGAVQPWMRMSGGQGVKINLLLEVAKAHGFSADTPAKDLPAKDLEIVFNGTGNKIYLIGNKKYKFAGVLKDLIDKYLSTDSEYVRKELEQFMTESICPECKGQRLRKESLSVKIGEYNISDLSNQDIGESIKILKKRSEKNSNEVEVKIIKEIVPRLTNLEKVGLAYLSLDRSVNTLSGGEVTRVRLATQLSSGLTGVIYVLDEPSVGLHPRDNAQLIKTLKFLRDLGNSVIVVEHDSDMMKEADYLIDVGPGAGLLGGEIIFEGDMAQIKKESKSLTGQYLSGKAKIDFSKNIKARLKNKTQSIVVKGAGEHNLKKIDVSFPLGKLVSVTGVSGSGKSSLVIDILGRALSAHFHRAKTVPGKHSKITGLKNIDKVIAIDQTPIGRTPRSNPATYTGVFTLIRDLFANLPEAKMRRYDAGKFSFNVKGGGRCEACAGEGYVRIPMQFLADVYVECNECSGTRYNKEALEINYHNKNIADVLAMTVEEAYKFFRSIPAITKKLNVLREVGLGYVQLGQPATTLSGGEAQRVKLATELSRASTGKTLYILDEPTTGLHFEDISRLLEVLHRLVDKGNSVLIIEHNLDVIKNSDWVIDIGPEGGKDGGELIFAGTPTDIIKCKNSYTGKFLKK